MLNISVGSQKSETGPAGKGLVGFKLIFSDICAFPANLYFLPGLLKGFSSVTVQCAPEV